jgi:transposase-like protein
MFDPPFDYEPSSKRVEHAERVRQRARRNWTTEAKGRLVVAMLTPGANVSEIARENEISRQHLYLWRRAALAGRLPLPAPFNSWSRGPSEAGKPSRSTKPAAAVEIEVPGFIVRVYPEADPVLLAKIVQILKGST